MIYFVTNRNLIPPQTDGGEIRFGHDFNRDGGNGDTYSELRLGWFDKKKERIHVISEPSNPAALESNPPSRRLFNHYRSSAGYGSDDPLRNVVFFVHGFRNNFEASLAAARRIEEKYGVDVLLFSWPSMGDGLIDDVFAVDEILGVVNYRADKARARIAATALFRVFEKMAFYFTESRIKACRQKFTLLCHSMGAYVLKKAVDGSKYVRETSFFDNIFLAAPDVNRKNHHQWLGRLKPRGDVFVAINRRDLPLNASELKFGPEQKKRLGCHPPIRPVAGVYYLDYTDYEGMDRRHGYVTDPSWDTSREKPIALESFSAILNGGTPEEAIPEFQPEKTFYWLKGGTTL